MPSAGHPCPATEPFPGGGAGLGLGVGAAPHGGRPWKRRWPLAHAPSLLFLPKHGSKRFRWGSVAEPQVPPSFSSLSCSGAWGAPSGIGGPLSTPSRTLNPSSRWGLSCQQCPPHGGQVPRPRGRPCSVPSHLPHGVRAPGAGQPCAAPRPRPRCPVERASSGHPRGHRKRVLVSPGQCDSQVLISHLRAPVQVPVPGSAGWGCWCPAVCPSLHRRDCVLLIAVPGPGRPRRWPG